MCNFIFHQKLKPISKKGSFYFENKFKINKFGIGKSDLNKLKTCFCPNLAILHQGY